MLKMYRYFNEIPNEYTAATLAALNFVNKGGWSFGSLVGYLVEDSVDWVLVYFDRGTVLSYRDRLLHNTDRHTALHYAEAKYHWDDVSGTVVSNGPDIEIIRRMYCLNNQQYSYRNWITFRKTWILKDLKEKVVSDAL